MELRLGPAPEPMGAILGAACGAGGSLDDDDDDAEETVPIESSAVAGNMVGSSSPGAGETFFGSILRNKSNSPNSTDSSNSSKVPLHSLCTKMFGICGS